MKEIGKITAIKEPGAIFASAITGEYIDFSNYRQITFIVESGEGTAANTTLTVLGKEGADGTAAAIAFLYKEKGDDAFSEKESVSFGIGGASGAAKFAVITVTDDMLAKYGYERIAIKTTAVSSSTVPGAIYAVQSQPRYSE